MAAMDGRRNCCRGGLGAGPFRPSVQGSLEPACLDHLRGSDVHPDGYRLVWLQPHKQLVPPILPTGEQITAMVHDPVEVKKFVKVTVQLESSRRTFARNPSHPLHRGSVHDDLAFRSARCESSGTLAEEERF